MRKIHNAEILAKSSNSKDRSLANLKIFEKGESGNPKGRPPTGEYLSGLVKKELNATGTADIFKSIRKALGISPESKLTNRELMAKAMVPAAIRQVLKGDVRLVTFICELTKEKEAPTIINPTQINIGTGPTKEEENTRLVAILHVLQKIGALPQFDAIQAVGSNGNHKDRQ